MASPMEQQHAAMSDKKRSRRPKRTRDGKDVEGPQVPPYDISADNGAGTCSMVASFYKILQESGGLQKQLVDGCGQQGSSYTSRGSPFASPSPPPPRPPPSVAADGFERPTSSLPSLHSRPSSKSSSRSVSARRATTGRTDDPHGPRGFRAVVGIPSTPRQDDWRRSHEDGQDEKGDEEEDVMREDDDAASMRSGSYVSHTSLREDRNRMDLRYRHSHRGEGSRRDHSSELDAELNNLRMHLLQRANGTHTIPE